MTASSERPAKPVYGNTQNYDIPTHYEITEREGECLRRRGLPVFPLSSFRYLEEREPRLS